MTTSTAPQGSSDLPFDLGIPSPIGRLLELRASASESVVRRGGLSATQELMARPGHVEESLWDLCGSDNPPDLVLLTGSAGCGKTATIGHLLARDVGSTDSRFGDTLADATHSDSPNEDQVVGLANFFAPFADDHERPGGPTRLIAINTGMVMKFFSDLKRSDPTNRLRGLETFLKHRLGLPGHIGAEPPAWMEASILVVNLDLRPTAGKPGDLFDNVLSRLNPNDPDGVLEGTPRCRTCKVVEWCWPMANATAMSEGPGKNALNQAAGTASMRRGRELPLRALWDVAAELALSGLETIPGEDPCAAIAAVADQKDESALLAGLACHNALDDAEPETLIDELATADPTYTPNKAVHQLLSAAGLTPGDDSRRLLEWLSPGKDPHPAVRNAGKIISQGHISQHPRAMARAAWLGGAITAPTELHETFANALKAQAAGATPNSNDEAGTALLRSLEEVSEGLAAGFGTRSGVETYYPTEAPGPRKTDVLVSTDLLGAEKLWTSEKGDQVRLRNPRGADLVGYRQLALAVRIGSTAGPEEPIEVPIDYPLWELLQQARQGTAPSTVDLDRYLSLRRAMEGIGREAGRDRRLPLLVLQRSTGRRFRVAPLGPTLRATEVE